MYTRILQPGAFSDNVNSVDFVTNEPVDQCDVPVIKNTFVDDYKSTIRMINN